MKPILEYALIGFKFLLVICAIVINTPEIMDSALIFLILNTTAYAITACIKELKHATSFILTALVITIQVLAFFMIRHGLQSSQINTLQIGSTLFPIAVVLEILVIYKKKTLNA